jgi:hypothetical protein
MGLGLLGRCLAFDPSRFSPLLITRQLVPVGEAVLCAPLPTGSWLVPPPWGGLRPGITSWVARSNALIRSSLNRQLCELPAASHVAVQVKGQVASSYWGHHSAPGVNLPVKFQARHAHRRRRR